MFIINGEPLEINRFPDQTQRLNLWVSTKQVVIQWLYEKDEEMILYFITSHLRDQYSVEHITLKLPYIPHARMDRVKESSEVFTLKYFCNFINSMAFDQVIVRDAHSYVALALINKVVCEDLTPLLTKLTNKLLSNDRDIIFYPDEGSAKRYSEHIQFPSAFGLKRRDWKSGKILSLEVQGAIPQAPFNALIIDDIASYGGTFLHAATKLKELGAQDIYLYITHCENAILDGELIQSGLIKKIFTTKSIYNGQHPLIETLGDEHYV